MLGVVAMAALGCRPSDVLSVPAPAGVVATSGLENQSGAESIFNGAKAQVFAAIDGSWGTGLLMWTELLSDEFTFSGFSTGEHSFATTDARLTIGTAAEGFTEGGDYAWPTVLQARSSMLLAIPGLVAHEPASSRSKIGEAYALAGYTELVLAESYCAGTALNRVLPNGGVQYGGPLTTDSLLGVAELHFDSAVVQANGDATVGALANVGLGRALLDRGKYAAAAATATSVPTAFMYNTELESNTSTGTSQGQNIYGAGAQQQFNAIFNVADREGQNGLDFVSANDPRLVLDTTTYQTADGTAWRLPVKFEVNLSLIPLATGVEARLIGAEAALQLNQVDAWATAIRGLREDSADTRVAFPVADSLPTDSVEGAGGAAQVDLMFRERAFWLFGTGSRLGDLRRLIRQYGRDQSTVFPIGPYVNGNNPNLETPIPTYGTDVNLTLPTSGGLANSGGTISNPNYKGCITSTKTA